MKIGLRSAGVCMMLGGGVWFLQGINVLPGSFMTGQVQWAIYGGLAFAAGMGLLAWANPLAGTCGRRAGSGPRQ
jgi:hypothetical protein